MEDETVDVSHIMEDVPNVNLLLREVQAAFDHLHGRNAALFALNANLNTENEHLRSRPLTPTSVDPQLLDWSSRLSSPRSRTPLPKFLVATPELPANEDIPVASHNGLHPWTAELLANEDIPVVSHNDLQKADVLAPWREKKVLQADGEHAAVRVRVNTGGGGGAKMRRGSGNGPAEDKDSPLSRFWRKVFKCCKKKSPEEVYERRKSNGMCQSAAAMKEKVRENLHKKEYNVMDCYKESGCFPRIARSDEFNLFTLLVVVLNTVWIGVSTNLKLDLIEGETSGTITNVEHAFCIYFTSELLIRYCSFRQTYDAFNDGWFKFDFVLVTLMVLETWMVPLVVLASGGQGPGTDMSKGVMLRMLRLARLTKMSRIMRLLRSVPELLILLRGMACAFRTVFFTMSLLIICLYVFGIIMVETTKEIPVGDKHFSSVEHAMWSLLIYGTLLDNVAIVADELAKQGGLPTVFFLLFVCVAAFTVLNMLIGVLCEVINSVSAAETEEITVSYIKNKMLYIMKGMDENDDGMISKIEFQNLLTNREAVLAMREVGVDVMGLIALQDVIFAKEPDPLDDQEVISEASDYESEDPGSKMTTMKTMRTMKTMKKLASSNEHDVRLSFGQFLECLLQLRGSNTATVADITNLRKYIRHFHQIQDRKDLALWECLEKLQDSVDALAQPQERKCNNMCAIGSSLPLLPIGSAYLPHRSSVAKEDWPATRICSAPLVRDCVVEPLDRQISDPILSLGCKISMAKANGYADEQPSTSSTDGNSISQEKQLVSTGHTPLVNSACCKADASEDGEKFVEPQNLDEDMLQHINFKLYSSPRTTTSPRNENVADEQTPTDHINGEAIRSDPSV